MAAVCAGATPSPREASCFPPPTRNHLPAPWLDSPARSLHLLGTFVQVSVFAPASSLVSTPSQPFSSSWEFARCLPPTLPLFPPPDSFARPASLQLHPGPSLESPLSFGGHFFELHSCSPPDTGAGSREGGDCSPHAAGLKQARPISSVVNP